jgi:Tfp pilus assembly protein PilF
MSLRTGTFWSAVLLVSSIVAACSRRPAVPDETYRQAVTSFYVSLAAMQTSQDVHARTELDRLIQLVPDEAAGWANLGLLLLRQQQFDEAGSRLARAASLAPRNAAIVRLLALTESRKGNLDEAIRHWRRATQLDPSDLKAPYALAQDLERLGGPSNEAEAQRMLHSIAARSSNLAAQLEHARLSAKRGDAASLGQAIDRLAAAASSWPADAQQRLAVVRQAAAGNPTAATTAVIFLKNVLIREPVYRSALSSVTAPRGEAGEPLLRLVSLPNPDPQPAPPDEQLAFHVDGRPAVTASGTTWAGAVWLTGDGRPTVMAIGGNDIRLASGDVLAIPGGTAGGPDSVVAADLNYDFRTDVVAAGTGGLQIFRQTGKGFSSVLAEATLPADIAGAPLHGVWTADLDTEGDLDLVVARRDGPPVVLRNNGDSTFTVQSPFPNVSRLRGFAWGDFDGEGVPDAVLLDADGRIRLFLNLRGFAFREQQVPAGFPRVSAVAAAEVSGDGILDVVGVSPDGDIARLSRRADGREFEAGQLARIEVPPGMTAGGVRLVLADLDNNGASDLIVSTRDGTRIALGGQEASYRQLGGAGIPGGVTAAADLDGDGRLELPVRADDGARLARGRGGRQYHWQAVRPRAVTATGDQRINSFGVGGEVEVRTGLHAQKQVIAAPVVHFGLGHAMRAEVARITWPNGVLQSEFDLGADTAIAASQRLKGSCPWLFAWNGREMAFVTDFIWRSPLGLRINAQATADVLMTEDRVRIRGDQLTAKDGRYDLRITAELWETHFFDLLSLMVVDHPEDTEVFVDERFAIPAPRLDVIATSRVQELAAVRDDQGRDVGDVVGNRDDRHLDFAGRGRYQGVTREHYVEMELPDTAPRAGPLWLVAQGWVHPTDSSINVALGQGRHPRPTGLSLHVADARGRFALARSGLGFPAGKDKTILIDLSGTFPPSGPRRFRLSTNLEIFWDRLGWAKGRPDVTLQPRRLGLASADLRFRGYSATGQKDASTPERPRYLLAGTAPRWRDLEGFHTRFGDVRELLTQVDDRYVIMNAGDEMRVTFPEVPATPAGMVRDFVLVGDGWEKDGDYNTTASRTVLPLPTHRSASYVPGSGRLEDDPVYRRHRSDFERYHTRYVSGDAVRDALRIPSNRGSELDQP